MAAKRRSAKSKARPDQKTLSKGERQLPCNLTDTEVQASAERASEMQDEADRLTLERKSAADYYKGRIQDCEKAKRDALREVRTRTRIRLVDVETLLLVRDREVVTVRKDTGELVERRAAKPEDLQSELFGQAGAE